MRKAHEQTGGQRASALLPRRAHRLEILVRRAMRALCHHVRQHRRGAPDRRWPHLAPHHAQKCPRRTLRGLPLIDMRIGLVAGDNLGVAHHRIEEIGVHVVGDADRRLRIDRADAAQQCALAIVEPLGDHGAMQIEPQRIVATLGYRIGDYATHGLVRVAVHRSAGRGAGTDRHDDLGADLACHRQIPAHAGAGPAEELNRRLAAQQRRSITAEAFQLRRYRREGVGLMRQGRQQQPHRFFLRGSNRQHRRDATLGVNDCRYGGGAGGAPSFPEA